MAEYSSWRDWIAGLPEIYGEGTGNPDTYLIALRSHLDDVPRSLGGADRHLAVRELNRRLRGLGRISYSGAKSRVALGLAMAGATLAGAFVAAIVPAAALGGLAVALNELRIYQDDSRVKRVAIALENEIDRLIERLDAEP